MARGPYYTARENAILISLIKDFPKANSNELADMAIKYGSFPNRTTAAITQQIRRLKEPASAENDNPEQVEFDFNYRRYEAIESKYEALISTILDKATLYAKGGYYGLSFDIPEIRDWLYVNESDRVAARLDSLITEHQLASLAKENQERLNYLSEIISEE